MGSQKYTLTFDAQFNISQMKAALTQIQSSLGNLHLPQNITKGLEGTFRKLSKEVSEFEVAASKDITKKSDFTKVEKSADRIISQFERLKLQIKDLSNLPDANLEKLFPKTITDNLNKAKAALKQYDNQVLKYTQDITKAQGKVQDAQNAINRENSKTVLSENKFKQLKTEIKDVEDALTTYKQLLTDLNNKEQALSQQLGQNKNKSSRYRQVVKDIQDTKTAIATLQTQLTSLTNQFANSTTNTAHAKDLAKLNQEYTQATQNLANLQAALANLQSTQVGGGVEQLIREIEKLTGLDLSKLPISMKTVADAITTYLTSNLGNLRNNFNQVTQSLNGLGGAFTNNKDHIQDFNQELEEFDTRAKDINALKMRITYFFGLNNAIQLARRAVRSAFNTIKELDKAMTETAVVTDFTVSDMWAQLPEYTKRAKELGISTLEAYQAATLYYQQGLKTNEVVAISNETLKMARIAGLEAAEATDRMTNALRGFNMELNETSAQRVDDVYSKLAAITASDVDEISTAMTKVASLANNANMQFENTAAFLAQIIETTRESAETAGTALKTVIARFSEVKNLYSEDELSGTDEEGQEIDVNKISKALRIANIDLNKYFLGEVGLDEIFMELASKWDSLTKVQQRYIATQAAGSRQQSRFIALMSDYARTQELTTAAFNAGGAAAKQFEKTQASLQSKLARLKDAWDEFVMGITNSSLVKGAVDFVTWLLNAVNDLTSGFGTLTKGVGGFVNALAKISLTAGLLSLGNVATKGLIANLIGKDAKLAMASSLVGTEGAASLAEKSSTFGLLGRGFISPFAGIGHGISNISKLWKDKEKVTLASGRKLVKDNTTGKWLDAETGKRVRVQPDIAEANKLSSSLFKKIGSNTGLGTWLTGKGMTVTAAGATTLGIAFAGVTAAAIAMGVAIKKAYDASPEGQLKIAEKLDKTISNLNGKITEANTNFKKNLESYNQYIDKIEEATYGTNDWADALEGVNNSVHQLLESYPDLIKFVEVSGSGVMTISEQGIKQAQKELEWAQKQANFLSSLSKGNVAQKQGIFYEQGGLFGQGKDSDKANLFSARSTAYYRAALTQQFGDRFSEEVINAISETLDFNSLISDAGKEYGYGKFLGKDFWRGKTYWRNEYEARTGTKADESWSTNEIVKQLSSLDSLKTIEETLTELNGKIGDENTNEIAQIIGKNAEFDIGSIGPDLYDIIEKAVPGVDGEGFGRLSNFDTVEEIQLLRNNNDPWFGAFEEWFQQRYGVKEEDYATLADSFNVDSIEEFFAKYIQGILFLQDEYTKNIKNAQGIFDKNFTADAISTYKNAFETMAGGSPSEYGLTAKQYSDLSEVITSLGLAGAGNAVAQLQTVIGGISDEEKRKQALQILSGMDTTSTDSILSTFTKLEDLGINFEGLGDSALEATNSLIKMAHASGEVDFEKLKEKVKDTSKFISDLKERDNDNKTFTQEEFDKFIKGTSLEDSFIYTGIEGQEYVYKGQLDSIVDILQKQLNLQIDNARTTLDKQVDIGEYIQRNPNLIGFIEEITRDGRTNITDWQRKILNDNFGQFGYDFTTISLDNIKTLLSDFLGYSNNLDLLQQEQADYNKYTLVPQYTQKSLSEIQTSTEAQPYYDDILEAKLQTDEAALGVYNAIEKKLKETVKDDTERLRLAKELAIVYSEQSQKIDKLNEKIKENSDGLKVNNKAAIRNVAKELSSIYGIDISDEFVESNKEALLQMEEDQESYYKVLSALHEAWIKENWNGLNELTNEQQTWINNIEQQIAEVPPLDIYTNLDTSGFNSSMAGMFDSVEEFEQFIASLGWAIDWKAYGDGVDKNDLQGLLSGEMHLVRLKGSGTGQYSGASGGGGGGGKSGWKNEQDRLYNLLQDIAEEQRKQTKLQEDYDRIISDPNATSQDLIKNLTDQLNSYKQLYGYQAARYVERQRDIEEYQKENSEYGQYVWYNKEDKTVEQNWPLINALKEADKEKYDKIIEIKGHLENLESDMDEADDSMREIESQVRELQNVLRDSYIDFENRVRDALIASQQQVIDNYSELNDTLSQTASDILQSLQDEIAVQRQIRDNTKTEDDINQKEARLAYLRRDTTGKNQQEILRLEKELDESRQNYEDTLIDQAIERLSEENNKTVEQREHQIEIMQAQLDYQQKNGEFNEEVKRIINEGIDENGHPVQNSELTTLLKNAEGWDAMTQKEREVWDEKLANETIQVGAYLSGEIQTTLNNTQNVIDNINGILFSTIPNKLDAIEAAIGGIDIPEYQPSVNYNITNVSGSGLDRVTDDSVPDGWNKVKGFNGVKYVIKSDPLSGLDSNQAKLVNEFLDKNNFGDKGKSFSSAEEANAALNHAILILRQKPDFGKYFSILSYLRPFAVAYKTGGLNTYTGPAWLDGTASRPEYVLNADQTQAFLKLANVLPQLLSSSSPISNTKVAGDIYLDLTMNVDEIGSDYDVDKIAERVKEIIYDSSTYRNVNIINFTR